MKIPFYFVNVFSNQPFSGNPAAVCLLDESLSSEKYAKIARDLAQPVTTYVLKSDIQKNQISTRWFTPDSELTLCGHGSAAAAAVLFQAPALGHRPLYFQSAQLEVLKLELIQPHIQLKLAEKPWEKISFSTEMPIAFQNIQKYLEIFPQDLLVQAQERLCIIVEDEQWVLNYQLDVENLKKIPFRGITFSALSKTGDIVMRTFYPHKTQHQEDAVCGAVHAIIVPYWAKRLGVNQFLIRHLSNRGGETHCEYDPNSKSICLRGGAHIFAKGEIHI